MINTWSKFYYGFEVTADNSNLAFDEGGPELIATVRQGKYAPVRGLLRTADAMSDVGAQTYAITLDRSTRLVTISAAAPFSLLVATGSTLSTSLYAALGFTGADRTGTNIYTGNAPAMVEYAIQFMLQDYIEQGHWKRAIDPTVKRAADGTVEVVRFGVEEMLQFNLKYVTDLPMDGRVIRNNPDGVAALVQLMDWLITKTPIEFMPDENDPDTYITMLLEKTPDSASGTDFKLSEQYVKNLPGFFETKTMIFNVVST
jgi:hypothetical protein